MGDASLPRPWVHNLITRHSKKRDYFPPIFASVCRGALSLSSSCLFSLRVPGVSASKRADTHSAPSLNADPSLSSRTHQRDLPRYIGKCWVAINDRHCHRCRSTTKISVPLCGLIKQVTSLDDSFFHLSLVKRFHRASTKLLAGSPAHPTETKFFSLIQSDMSIQNEMKGSRITRPGECK